MNAGWGAGLSLPWGAHALSVAVFAAGLILIGHWMAKRLTEKQLLHWGAWLLAGGTAFCLLAASAAGGRWGVVGGAKCAMMRDMQDMRDADTDDDAMPDVSAMPGGMGMGMMDGDGMGMSMSGMSAMLRGKTGDAFDAAFLRMMIPHHQGAIDMANLALANAKHGEIREMATDIVTAQQREIDSMREWQRAWKYEQ